MGDFKPMLAADCEGDTSKLRFPLIASPKIDGIRCVIFEGKALTRSLKPIPNKTLRQKLESFSGLDGLDGELVIPGATFQATMSAVMSHDGDSSKVEFHVFDCVKYTTTPFQDRLIASQAICRGAPDGGWCAEVPHNMITSEEELLAFEAECLAQGYEGVMLRDPNGKYKHGRSTLKEGGLVKLKRFVDAEAVIVGFEERMHNTNEAYKDELGRTKRSSAQAGKVGRGDLGAFVLSMYGVKTTTVEFTCGSGLNDAQRVDFWARREELLGKLVKFKYLSHGMKDLPRHPTFIGLRDVRDL